MLAEIQTFARSLTPTNINPSLVVSKALALNQGTVASGANRYDADTIAKYEFQTGSGYTAYDTSGIDPAADLTISGNVLWAGGWGINIGAGGKAQASTSSSSKLFHPDPGDGRVFDRSVGRTGAGRGRQLLHGELLGRRHLAQLHARTDQPGL